MSTSTPALLILSRSLFGFSALCLLTSLVLNLFAGSDLLTDTVSSKGGNIGPITLKKDNTVLLAEVSQDVPRDHWSFIGLELQDHTKTYLTSFGDELWSEDGYDSEGYYWQESVKNYTAKVTVNKAGTYYLKVTPDNNFKPGQQRSHKIKVQLQTQSFSTIPHFAAAIIALILALLMNFIGGGLSRQLLTES